MFYLFIYFLRIRAFDISSCFANISFSPNGQLILRIDYIILLSCSCIAETVDGTLKSKFDCLPHFRISPKYC